MLVNRSIVRRLFVSSDTHACRDAAHCSSSSSQCSPRTGRGIRHLGGCNRRSVRFLNSPASAAAVASRTHSLSYHPSYSDPHGGAADAPRVTLGSLAQLRDPLLYSCGTCGSQCRISYSKALPVIVCRRCHIPLSLGAHTSMPVASVSVAQRVSVLDKVRESMYSNPAVVSDPFHVNTGNSAPNVSSTISNEEADRVQNDMESSQPLNAQAEVAPEVAAAQRAQEAEKKNERFLQGVTIVDSPEKARKVVDMLRSPALKEFYHCCDTEAVGLGDKVESIVGRGRIISASIFVDPSVDFGDGPRLWIDNLDDASGTLEVFKEYFEDESIKKVFHNYSFDYHILETHGIKTRGFAADTMHMARLWDVSRLKFSLEKLSHELLNTAPKVSIKQRFGYQAPLKNGSLSKLVKFPALDEVQRDPSRRSEWIYYCVHDAETTWHLRNELQKRLEEMPWCEGKTMFEFYDSAYRDFGQVLVDMESEGFYVRTDQLAAAEKRATEHKLTSEEAFRSWAASQWPDCKFMNVGSTQQVQQLLFAPSSDKDVYRSKLKPQRTFNTENTDGYIEPGKTKPKKYRPFTIQGLGMKPISKTAKGTPQASNEVLRKLAGNPRASKPSYGLAHQFFGKGPDGVRACEAIDSLCHASLVDTLLGTFIRPLQKMPDENGRIHCSLNLNTETGRISSRGPNLQNQPAFEKDLYKIRDSFAAQEGNSLIVADYGQLELRVLAHMTNCKSMLDAFEKGGDFHSRTAMTMYPEVARAVKSGEVAVEVGDRRTPDTPLIKQKFSAQRQRAKIFNFSVAYGKTAHGFAKDSNMTLAEAKDTIDRWYKDRPEVKAWQEEVIRTTRETGKTRTLMGRYRPISTINDEKQYMRSRGERAAVNTPIQGGAADIVMMAMIKIHKSERLREIGWKLLLSVHDEVILEGPSEGAQEASEIVTHCMAHPFEKDLLVELTVDLKIAPTWFQGK